MWLRPDWSSAAVVATLANIYRDRKAHPDAYEIKEFLLGGVEEWEQTPEQQELIAELSVGIFQAAWAQQEEEPDGGNDNR